MAIAVENVYNSLLTLIREDKRGNALSPDEYNRVANIVNERLFQKYYSEYEKTLDISDALSPFIKLAYPVLAGNVLTMPTDYKIVIGKLRSITLGTYLDYVTRLELDERQADYLTAASNTYPVWTYGGETGGVKFAYVYPATMTGFIVLNYLSIPTTPFYDYYVNDTTAVITYMDVSANVIIPSGSTYRDGTAGDGVTSFPSTSVDWMWNSDELQKIVVLFKEILGIAFPDQFLTETSNMEETKLNTNG